MTAQSLQSGVTVYDDFIKSEECHLPLLPLPFNFFLALVLTFVQQLTITRRSSLIRTRPSDGRVYAYTAISRNAFGKRVLDNPERYNCGWFLSSLFFREIRKNGTRGHGSTFASGKLKQQNRGTQREYSSKSLKHSIVKRTLVFKR